MLFFGKKKKKNNNVINAMDEVIEWGVNNAQTLEDRRYYEGRADKQYQAALSEYFKLIEEMREAYTVINTVGSFNEVPGEALIAKCLKAIDIDNSIRERREYYECVKFRYCEPYKTLAMVYEKREEFHLAASVCISSIEKGYTMDNTQGGMRGRLARMIKKGSLPLTEEYKRILNL